MKKYLLMILAAVFMAVMLPPGLSAEDGAELKAMKGVQVKKVSDDKSEVIIETTGLVKYHCFKVSDPPRLVIELSGTEHQWEVKDRDVENPVIERVRTSQFQDEPEKVVRIVLDLYDEIKYEAVSSPENITVTVFSSSPEKGFDAKMETENKEPVKKEVAEKETVKKEVVKKEPTVKKKKETKKQEVKKKMAVIENNLVNSDRNVEDLEHRKLVEKIREQEEEEILKEIKKDGGDVSVMEGVIPRISDELISLNFYQADITEVFRVLAEHCGMNFIYSSDVTGIVTIYLNNVSFDDAFRAVLKLNGLVAQKNADSIIRIVTPAKLRDERSKAVKITRKFSLKYTTAEDIRNQFDGMEFGGVQAIVKTDKTTNSLVITTTPEGLEEYEKIITALDVMPRQVSIEARIFEIAVDDVPMDIGADWAVARDDPDRSTLTGTKDNIITVGQTYDTANSLLYEGYDPTAGTLIHPSAGGAGVNLLNYIPTTGGLLRIGSVLSQTRFNLTIAALSQSQKVKELSHPRIITLNNEEASVLVGDKIPVKEKTVDDGAITETTVYINTGIELTVTPTINEDGYITLVVKPAVSSYSPEGDSYVVSTREATTKVLIKDGDTIVIGGLIQDREVISYNKVPLLGDIPIIGWLFRHKKKTKERTELLVFVTANILKDLH